MHSLIKKVIEDGIEWIDTNAFDCLYTYSYQIFGEAGNDGSLVGEMSSYLLESGIDPLQSLPTVPKYFLYKQTIGTDLTLPLHLKEVGMKAFCKCQGLRTLTLHKNIEVIRMYAFSECRDLHKVIIENGTLQCASAAFSYCHNLETIIFKGTRKEFTRNIITGLRGLKNILIVCNDETFTFGE